MARPGLGGINTQPGGPGGRWRLWWRLGCRCAANGPDWRGIGLQGGLRGGLAGIRAEVNQAGQTLSPATPGRESGVWPAIPRSPGPWGRKPSSGPLPTSGESPGSRTSGNGRAGDYPQRRSHRWTGWRQGSAGIAAPCHRACAAGLRQQLPAGWAPSPRRVAAPPDCWAGYRPTPGRCGTNGLRHGQSLAGGRTRAGEQIAGNLQGTTSALSQLINQRGWTCQTSSGRAATTLPTCWLVMARRMLRPSRPWQRCWRTSNRVRLAGGRRSWAAGANDREFGQGRGDSQRHRQLQHRAACRYIRAWCKEALWDGLKALSGLAPA